MNGIYEEVRIVLYSIWRQRWLSLAVCAAVCLLGWTAIALIPNSYESEARVSVETQDILSGTTGVSASDHQRVIERVQQTLVSTVNLEKVVRGTELGQRATSPGDIAAMVEMLRKNIGIKTTQDNLFQITARSSAGGLSDSDNAKLARATVQKLLDIFVEENLVGSRTETTQTLRFLDSELSKREGALREAETRRADFEQRYAGLLPGVGSIAQRMEAARAELNTVDSNLAAAQASLAALNGQMAGTPASIAMAGGGGTGGGAVAALQAQIAEAQSRGWTEQHPDIIAMRSQLARLRQIAPQGGGGAGSTANPMYVTLRSMQAEKQATAAALQARKAQLSSDMAAFTTRMAEEPGVAAEQQRLDRDYGVLKDQYDKLLADREAARLRNDVAAQTDSVRFRVVDPPSTPRVPVAPNRPLLLAVVLVLGGIAGIGVAFAKSQLQPTYATADRMARATGLPVLGGISEVLTPPVKADRRKKLVWFGGASGALAASFALLLVIEFVQRGMVD